MQLLAFSLNHKRAPLALRETVAFSPERALMALPRLRRLVPQLAESAIVSTCNRTEIYGAVEEGDAAAAALTAWLAAGNARLHDDLRAHTQVLCGAEAARHVFRVASGLESMVLGEPQILGQMKSALRHADGAGTLGPLLHQLFQRAFAVAKEVRTRTQIGRGAVSHAAVAVELARGLFGDLRACRVLFIGAGAMIESVVPHFAAEQPAEITVANRTPARGERITRRWHGQTRSLAELPDSLHRFDVVVSCTGSTQPLITADMVRRSRAACAGAPWLMIDLGVPRDLEPEISAIAGVSLYTIDDLGKLVKSRASGRADAVAHAERIIETHVKVFMEWNALRPCVPLLRRLNDQAERLRAAELQRARRMIAQGHPVEEALSALSAAIANKLLHPPRALLHGSTAPDQAQRILDQWIGALEQGVRL